MICLTNACWVERQTPPLTTSRVNMLNQISTWFNQEAYVGVK